MSQKLKIILGVLVVAAAFLVIRVGSSFFRSAKNAALISQTLVTPAPEENLLTKDSDGDGLSDRDEIIYGTDPYNKDTDGDGYWDGEEIATGYDPLDGNSNPKAGNTIGVGSANVTKRAANLVLASIIGDNGQIDKTRITYDKIDEATSTVLQEAALSFSVPVIQDLDIKISNDNSQAAIQKYLNSVAPIIEENMMMPNLSTTTFLSIGSAGLSKNYPKFYENTYESLKILEVPSSWKEIHKQALQSFLKLSDDFNALTQLDQDPIRAAYAIVLIQDNFLQFMSLLNQAAALAKFQNVDTRDTILETLKSEGTTK